ncbi:hypothetical protein J4481_02035 [Candidatus Pacearchaeota archaeon]|nr:hypothetical protein [Candidatus Pacearchaeota archaeon]
MTKENIDFKEMEDKWQKFWESEGIYRADLKKKKIYSVVSRILLCGLEECWRR